MRRPRAVAALLALLVAGSATLAASPAAASNCKVTHIADWPVRLVRNKLIVDGAIDGQKIGVMLDTGAQRSLIVRSATERLGLAKRQVRGYRMFGIGGETYVESAMVNEFKIGDLVRRNWRILVAGERDFGDHIDAILGEDFFYQVDVEFDLAHGAVRLYETKGCENVSLAYWTTERASEVEFERIFEARPQIILTVQINGEPIRALLDSGATTSVLGKSDAARVGITPDSPGVIPVGKSGGLGRKSVDTWIGPFASVTIGDEIVRDTTLHFADLWKDATYTPIGSHLTQKVDWTPSMLLGADFLRAHRVLIAHSQHKIYFSYAGGPVFQANPPPDLRSPPRPDSRAKSDTGGH